MTEETLNQWYNEYSAAVYSFLRYKGASEAEAEDYTQETFFRAYKWGPDKVDYVKAYLFKVAISVLSTAAKKEQRTQSVPLDEVQEIQSGINEASNVDNKLLRQRILEVLHTNKPILAELFSLRVDYKMKFNEIAKAKDISTRTVRRHFQKIKGIIKENFEGDLFDDN